MRINHFSKNNIVTERKRQDYGNTLIILGNGFDTDLGFNLSFKAYSNCHLNPTCGLSTWHDYENYLRDKILKWVASDQSEQTAKDINEEWQAFTSNFSYFFTKNTSDLSVINSTSNAYTILENLTKKSSIYTFNYTYPFEYVAIPFKGTNYQFVHGRYYRDTFDKLLMVMSQHHNMIVGIDCDKIPDVVKVNEYLQPLIKQLHSSYQPTNLSKDLIQSETVVFFGFSLGIVDYDYFADFFNSIINGNSVCKQIFIITYNNGSLSDMEFELKKQNLSFSQLNKFVEILPIFNENDSTKTLTEKSDNFKKLLSFI